MIPKTLQRILAQVHGRTQDGQEVGIIPTVKMLLNTLEELQEIATPEIKTQMTAVITVLTNVNEELIEMILTFKEDTPEIPDAIEED